MKAMLLAAGKGERLRPFTDSTPKCMIKFEGKPLLQHWVEKLRTAGIREAAINVHHLPQVITDFLGDGERWGINIRYSHEEKLLGTAGAVKNLEQFFSQKPFLVIYTDNFSTCDLKSVMDFHEDREALATMSVCWIDDPSSCGIVGFDERGCIRRFLEKPSHHQVFSHYINAGTYIFDPEIFRFIPAGVSSDLSADIFPRLLREQQPIYAYRFPGYVLKFDTHQDWQKSAAYETQCTGG